MTKLRLPSKLSYRLKPLPKKSGSKVIDSARNFAEVAAVHGDKDSLELIKKAVTSKASGRLERFDASNPTGSAVSQKMKRFRTTVLQAHALTRKEASQIVREVSSLEKRVGKAISSRQKRLSRIAISFGVRAENAKISLPPFTSINYSRPASSKKPVLIPDGSGRVLYLELKPTDPFFTRRVARQGPAEKERSAKARLRGIGFASIKIEKIDGERVLVVDNVQNLPQPLIEMLAKPKRPGFPEFREFPELLVLNAMEIAKANGIRRVVLPDSEHKVKGYETSGKKPAWSHLYDRLGRRFNGKKVELDLAPFTINGAPLLKRKMTGFEWRLTK